MEAQIRRLSGRRLPRTLEYEDLRQEAFLALLEFRRLYPEEALTEKEYRFILRRLYHLRSREWRYSTRMLQDAEQADALTDENRAAEKLWLHIYVLELLSIAGDNARLFRDDDMEHTAQFYRLRDKVRKHIRRMAKAA